MIEGNPPWATSAWSSAGQSAVRMGSIVGVLVLPLGYLKIKNNPVLRP